MQLMEDRPLELDESEMFEDELEDVGPVVADPASLLLSSAPAAAAAALQAAQEEGESESDDDGIVLESECSSSEAEDEVEQELVGRIQSLQSSLDHPATVKEGLEALGTSHSSQVGSLKSFGGMSFKGKRLFGSEGDLATSMPVRSTAPMLAARRRVAPEVEKQPCNLGTSMPISIPMMQRRSSAADLAAAVEERVAAATFVPPHMLHRQETERFDLVSASGGELGLSPSAKREKLLARNAILRSTGFIEVQQPPTMGEVLDPVKEQLLGAVAASGALAVPAARPDARATPRSSLTQMLGTSK